MLLGSFLLIKAHNAIHIYRINADVYAAFTNYCATEEGIPYSHMAINSFHIRKLKIKNDVMIISTVTRLYAFVHAHST